LLSFDDGLSQVYDVIVPILKQMGIPAIFFINPDFINNKQLYYRFKASIVLEKVSTRKFSVADLRNIGISIGVKINSYSDFKKHILSINYLTKDKLDTLANEIGIDFNEFLKEIKPYLDETQIKQLVSEGFTIGAHSMGHPEYFNISHEFQILQTTQSISFVRQLSPKGARFFSFPYSDFGVSKKFFDEVFNEKNRLADLSFGTSGLKIDQCGWNLQRIPMEKYKYGAMEALCMQYSKYFAYSIIGKHLIKR
jgi:peptidoglycan/xylan/chitin deacetylase (PgdA/CDA1 family)